ncbi:helix-turn-helix domain-containing protein [Tunturiibacter gelidiferens]|uniref:helix-turn-helix domain-containing protein n=1 Tax=Tunturiibacter gelidiferens TaxID=3069689 RepID=UPI003D9B31D6
MQEKSQFSREYGIFLRRLRAARERAGFSQEQLALTLSHTQSTISKMERGERRVDAVVSDMCCTWNPQLGFHAKTRKRFRRSQLALVSTRCLSILRSATSVRLPAVSTAPVGQFGFGT